MDNYDYKGEKFLNRLYKDLDLEDVVMHTALPSDGKEEKVKKYLDRLRKVEELAKNSKHNGIELLKEMYYKKYVIKEENIPESYFELQKKIALDRGLGHVEINEGMRQQLCESVIKDQKKSLDAWIDYFLSEDSFYPEWFEYYAFQGMLKLGSYDKERSTFTKRTDTTTNIFIDLNREALALVYDNLVDALDGKEVDDETLKKLLDGGNFSKLYSYFIKKLDQANKDIDSNEGKWVKYNQGSEPDELVKSLEGKGTGWCTAGYETARTQLAGGDFYVYYTKDSSGEYKQPRIAIRMSGTNEIGEIRGIAEHQNMESEMEEVLEKKLEEFPDKERYQKKVSDMNKLTSLYNRYIDVKGKIDALKEKIGPIDENNRPLDVEEPIYEKSELEYKLSELEAYYNNDLFSIEELKFLYEIDVDIDGFGYRKDPRIDEILDERYFKKDLSKIFNCSLNEISNFTGDVLNGKKITYFYGDLNLNYYSDFKKLRFPECVIGDLFLDNLGSTEGLELPKYVSKSLYLRGLKSAKNLKFPESVGGDLDLESLEIAEGLELPKSIGGYLGLDNLESSEGLKLPESIGDYLVLDGLKSAEGLELPKNIGGILYLRNLKNAKGLKFPESLLGDIYLTCLKSAVGLELPKSIGGELNLSGLESPEGLKLPESIGKGLDLQNLKSAENLKLSKSIGGYLDLSKLANADNLELPKSMSGDLYLSSLIRAEGLELPESIGGDLWLESLENVEGLKFPKYIGGSLNLRSLESAEGLVLPESVGRYLSLARLKSAEGLKLPKSVGGDLDLNSLKSAEGLEFPKYVGRGLDLRWLESAKGLKLPESIGGDLVLSSLKSIEDLKLPKSIANDLWLDSLESAECLELPKYVGGGIYMSHLKSAENVKFPEYIGGGLYLQNLKSVDGLIIPENFECEGVASNYITIKDLENKLSENHQALTKSRQRGYSSIIVLSILTSLVSILIIVLGVFLNK